MRTTLTLDDDVAIELNQRSVESGESFQETVNRVIRAGLGLIDWPAERPEPYRIEPVALGRCAFKTSAMWPRS